MLLTKVILFFLAVIYICCILFDQDMGLVFLKTMEPNPKVITYMHSIYTNMFNYLPENFLIRKNKTSHIKVFFLRISHILMKCIKEI